MDFGLISVLLDSVIQASVMVNEHSDRKKQQKHDHLTAVIQQLDVDSVTAPLRPATLAGYMRGAVTAALVGPIIKSPSFRGLIKEMFLAVLTDHGNEKLDRIRTSMSLVIASELRSKARGSDIEYFCENLEAALTSSCESVVATVRVSNPETLVSLQNTALLKRLTTVLENIDRHSSSLSYTSSDEAAAKRKEWLTTYGRLCEKDHGHIVPPDFDTSRKIPMSKLYVVPTISTGGPNSYRDGTAMGFEAFRSGIDRTVLLGDPGGGKSTLSDYLASYWATSGEGIVPFHVTLREYAKQPNELSVAGYIEQQLDAHYQHPAPAGLVEELLISGEAVVIFDGLDELIDTTKRRAVSAVVELFGIKYPLAAILVTSRRIGYDQARLDPDTYRVRVIAEFKPDDVRDYVHKWFASQEGYSEQEAERLAGSFIAQSESVTDLRTNPLMLALMCIIFRGENFIPRNRPAVYEKCSTLLFEKWDGHRAIEVPLEARAHVNAALMYVAHWMLSSGSGDIGVSYDKLVREMATYLRGRAFETEDAATRAAAEFVDFCKGRAWVFADAGTTADGEPLFTFTHRTFMEYFAAFHLTRIHDTPEKLARGLLPKVAAEEWDVVAQLAIQIEDKAVDRGSERALRVMIDEPRKRTLTGRTNVLSFVGRCASFSTLSPAFMRDFSELCLALMLDNLTADAEQEISIIGPWLSVMRAALGTHRDVVADVHVRVIGTALQEVGTDRWKAASELLFLGIGLTWSSALRPNSPWSSWWETFNQITHSHASCLRAFRAAHPAYRPALVVTGVESVDAAVKTFDEERDEFFIETFFGSTESQLRYFMIPNLAAILWEVASGPLPLQNQPEAACAEPLAVAFLNAFWSEAPKRIGDASRETIARVAFGDDLKLETNNKPQSVVDAALLIALADHEIMTKVYRGRYPHEIGGFIGDLLKHREKRSGAKDVDFGNMPFSGRVIDFTKRWIRWESCVFIDSTPIPSSSLSG